MAPASRATMRSCRWPGATSETQIGRPSGRMTACTFPPGARCLPEYQALIVSPLTLTVVSAQRAVRIGFPSTMTCDQTCSATSLQGVVQVGGLGGEHLEGLVAVSG